MRVEAGAWLLLLAVLVQLPEISTRKINNVPDNAIDTEAEKDDETGFGFLTTTLSSLTNFFRSSDDDAKPDENVVDKNDDDLNEAVPRRGDVDPDPPQNDDNIVDDDFSENGIGTSDEAKPEVPKIVEELIPPEIDPLLETEKEKDEKEEEKPNEEPKEDVEELLEEIADTENKILNKLNDDEEKEEEDTNSETPRPQNGTTPVLLDKMKPGALMPVSLLGAKNVSDNSSLMMLSDMHYHRSAGMPEVHDLEMYIRHCDSCLVEQDAFQCPLNVMAMDLKKWIIELEELLSYGCQLGDGCDGARKCCHSNEEALRLPVLAMTQAAEQMYNAFQSSCSRCPRHGGWGEWCEWGACSTTCGRGTRTRSRKCNSPAPRGDGRHCQGMAVDTESCGGADCCTDGQWSQWSSWGMCPVTCGESVVGRWRKCDSPPPNYCGRPCPGRERDTRTCGTGRECCVHGSWSQWEPWSRCSASCGRGNKERRRRCDSPRPNHCGRSCPGPEMDTQMCNTNVPCAPMCFDGNWGPWQPWSRCSATCGTGMQSRMRRCDNPAPNFCGRRCSGSSSDTQPCRSTFECCVHGNWSPWQPWSTPSVSCGMTMRDRRRRCDSPRPNHCGRTCPGPDMERESYDTRIPCRPACVHGNWGSWGRWSMPTVTCGMAVRERRRRCDSPSANFCGRPCAGPDMERDSYDTRTPCRPVCVRVDGGWSRWSPWSPCSASCGTGMRDRSRSCSNPPASECGRPCAGRARDTERCAERDCCTHGNWSPWSPWSPCSVTCGDGRRDRSRSCSNPPPNNCGRTCPGSPRDMERCNMPPCCTDRNWSPWEPWSVPTVSCGTAMRERRRRCELQRGSADCGRPCPGPDSERESYDTGVPCRVCVDGNWAPWSRWTPCSKTCGNGMQDRKRTCSNPPANFCGRPCMGPDKDMKRCNEGPCCIRRDGNWGPWTPWSQCTATCGAGSRERSRMCNNPRPNDCGRQCPGSPRESDRCDGGPCCVDGNWGAWERWSIPSVTCGRSTRERRRRCDRPRPNFCGRACPGPDVDTESYDSGVPCVVCVDGNWGSWAPWGAPTVTCGTGMRERRRRCDRPQPNFCGRQCSGPEVDTEVYDSRVPCRVCVDGNWGSWERWSAPSVTCGTSRRDRRRRCDRPRPNECGRSCPGRDIETDLYDTGVPCRVCVDGNWGPWERWSAPSVTCGTSRRDRRRRCDSPRPNECGRSCPGRDIETGPYDTGVPCRVCVDGNWGPWERWSVPSVTCGTSRRDRRRRCDSPRPNECGRSCPGRDIETDLYDTGVPCLVCVDGNWGSWAPWSAPSVTCGTGMRDRRRRCDSPRPNSCGRTCPGPDVDTQVHDTRIPCQVCIDGNWGPWERWGMSVTCGRGMRERRRRCDRPRPNFCGRSCPGRDVDSEVYDSGVPCQVCIDGNWGPWGSWGPCPVTCGMATRERRRSCDSPAPNFCGQACPGSPFDSRLQTCGPEAREGNWGPWGSWSGCSRTCGGGTETRNRRCDVSACGRPCPGFESDSRPCGQGPCCVDRQWTQWGPWSQCDVSCGRGRRTRQRSCSAVGFGQDCGNRCPGIGEEVDDCRGLPPCEAPWGPWSACSATCEGRGTRERRRLSFGGFNGISGSQTEQEICQVYSPPCPQPAEWSQWNEWCPCDCRKGMISRRRKCEERGRFGAGRQVDISNCGAGTAREEMYCDVRDTCPVCVSDCGGRVDGDYPSCTSCSDYVRCTNGRVELLSCRVNNYEYDAFIRKCGPPESPSCALVECVSSCAGREDGRYPSCFGCGSYVECDRGRDSEQSCPPGQEYNAHSKECGSGRSPTCIRAIRRSIDFIAHDAPADSYFLAEELEEKERKELYLELRKKAGVAAKFNRSDEDVFREEEEEEEKKKKEEEEKKKKDEEEKEKAVKEKEEEALLEVMKEEKDKKEEGDGEEEDSNVVIEEGEEDGDEDEEEKKKTPPETTIPKMQSGNLKCQTDCSGVKKGKYQSCKGCRYYLLCTHRGVPRVLKCPKGKFWDDSRKKCKFHSHTCMPRDANKTRP